MSIDTLLQPYKPFGIHLGLERINKLLADLGNPHHQVPIIHVAGTNGKGSVCAYLNSILIEAGYRVGRYTSPHLVDWTERICLNGKPISQTKLTELLEEIATRIDPNSESPTQFEVTTAAAWLYFARSQVDVAVMEVGLGGRLDATNVCDRPIVTVITSLSLEHWQRLGPTLAHIAREKAGILKAGCPAVIGKLPPEAHQVVAERVEELNCPTIWVEPATEINDQEANITISQSQVSRWVRYQGDNLEAIDYPLPLLGDVQLNNSALAIASVQILQQQGWSISPTAIQLGMAKTRWRGRMEWTTWRNRDLLIDGAHNPAAAQALRQYVDTFNQPVSWVMGMMSTKDHQDVFQALLRPGDSLYLVPVPVNNTAPPEALAILAQQACPDLVKCQTYTELFAALTIAMESQESGLVVLCGSLYLVGYFYQQNQ